MDIRFTFGLDAAQLGLYGFSDEFAGGLASTARGLENSVLEAGRNREVDLLSEKWPGHEVLATVDRQPGSIATLPSLFLEK